MAIKVSKGYKGIGMDGFVATWYAQITQKNIDTFRQEAQTISARVPQGSAVLEVAPGPGYLAIELAKLDKYKVTGLDISRKFVEIARAKARAAGVGVNFRHGNAAIMPFDDKIFHFIVCRAAFKNFAEPIDVLNEMYRVLKVGGTTLIIDLRGGVSPEAVDRHVEGMGLNPFNTLMTKLAFKLMLIKRAYTSDDFRAFVAQSDFRQCEIVEDDIGLEVWLKR